MSEYKQNSQSSKSSTGLKRERDSNDTNPRLLKKQKVSHETKESKVPQDVKMKTKANAPKESKTASSEMTEQELLCYQIENKKEITVPIMPHLSVIFQRRLLTDETKSDLLPRLDEEDLGCVRGTDAPVSVIECLLLESEKKRLTDKEIIRQMKIIADFRNELPFVHLHKWGVSRIPNHLFTNKKTRIILNMVELFHVKVSSDNWVWMFENMNKDMMEFCRDHLKEFVDFSTVRRIVRFLKPDLPQDEIVINFMLEEKFIMLDDNFLYNITNECAHKEDWLEYLLRREKGIDVLIKASEIELHCGFTILKFLEKKKKLNHISTEKIYLLCSRSWGKSKVQFFLDQKMITMKELFHYAMKQKTFSNTSGVFDVLKEREFDFTKHANVITECPSQETLKMFKHTFKSELESDDWSHLRDALCTAVDKL
jgi:hypothetical protein